MTVAGMDAYFWKYAKKKLLYTPLDDFLRFDIKRKKYFMQSDKAWKFNKEILNHLDGIIPSYMSIKFAIAEKQKNALIQFQ